MVKYLVYDMKGGTRAKHIGYCPYIMKAVITVIGKDMVGLLAKVSTVCANNNANVIEVTQSVLQEMFAMIMMVDITNLKTDLATLSDDMDKLAKEIGVQIHVMHEDTFNSMHRI